LALLGFLSVGVGLAAATHLGGDEGFDLASPPEETHDLQYLAALNMVECLTSAGVEAEGPVETSRPGTWTYIMRGEPTDVDMERVKSSEAECARRYLGSIDGPGSPPPLSEDEVNVAVTEFHLCLEAGGVDAGVRDGQQLTQADVFSLYDDVLESDPMLASDCAIRSGLAVGVTFG
jgi:hypothetical protein